MNAGDLVFCHSTGFVGRAIRFCEWLRRDWHGTNERAGDHWNHVAILDKQLSTGEWTVVQAEGRGVTRGRKLSSVAPEGAYEVVALPAAVTRAKVVAFAHSQVGRHYGFLTIVSIALTLFTPRFVNVLMPGTWICSALARAALWTGGLAYLGPDIYQCSPARLWIELHG